MPQSLIPLPLKILVLRVINHLKNSVLNNSSLPARNAASSYFAVFWMGILSVTTAPIYIHILGIAEWGLVAACLSLQLLSSIIDVGFSQIVPKWVAQTINNPSFRLGLVRYLRRIYFTLGLGLFVLLQLFAGFLAHDWFRAGVEADGLELAIRMVSFQLLFQFINNLNTGVWNGLERQVTANVRACFFGTLKHSVTITALLLTSPQAWIYGMSFAIVALAELLANTRHISRTLLRVGESEKMESFDKSAFLKEYFFLSGGILTGLLASFLDRLILSRTVDTEYFGIYATVLALALSFLQLQSPITRAYFPALVRQFSSTGLLQASVMRKVFVGTVVLSVVPTLIAFVFAREILGLWLGNTKFVEAGTEPLRLLLLAAVCNSMYGCIYIAIVASGGAKRIWLINSIALAMGIMGYLITDMRGQIAAGGVVWLSSCLTQLLLGIVWLIARLRRQQISFSQAS